MKSNTNAVAIILAGGLSSRMGSDKGFLTFGRHSNFIKHSFRKLKILFPEVYVSVREEQTGLYGGNLPSSCLITDEVSGLEGPFQGILSSFRKLRSDFGIRSFFFLPIDMPYVRLRTIERILSNSTRSRIGVFYRTEEGIEPLCGLYDREFLEILIREAELGKLPSLSPKSILEKSSPFLLELPGREKSRFLNVNFPSDLGGFVS